MIDYDVVNSFIGREWVYKEFDCWELLKQASRELFDIDIKDVVELPSFEDTQATSEVIKQHREYPCWEKVDDPRGGDMILLFDRSGEPVHVGLYIMQGNILHCMGSQTMKNGRTRYDHVSVIKLIYPKFEAFRYADNDTQRPG